MATVERIEPAFRAWTPSMAGMALEDDEEYVGKHRKPGLRRWAFVAMFYAGRHRRHDVSPPNDAW